MKIYVACDMEGIGCLVDHRAQCWPDGKHYDQARRLATLELNALIEGALEGGATEILAWDGHCSFPGCFDMELLHPECRMVLSTEMGAPVALDGSFDAVFLLGLHAMAGTEHGVMCHSFWGGIDEVTINGHKVGEIAVIAHTAGAHGVPVVFISGDQAAAEEAKAIIPDIETAVVKYGVGTCGLTSNTAIALAPGKAQEVIRNAARRAMGKAKGIPPFRFDPPYTARTRYKKSDEAQGKEGQQGSRRVDEYTLEVYNPLELDLVL